MQGGNENENNDDVNDANVYVKKCDPVFNSFVACLSVRLPGKSPRLFLLDWSVINDSYRTFG